MEIDVVTRLTTLGHPKRLAIFRLLMRRYPDPVPAGEIGIALNLKPSTLSAYLGALVRAGLVEQERVGTSLRYRIIMEAVQGTFDYLLNDCCRGRADLCAPFSPPLTTGPKPMSKTYDVLFICSGNSARSIFAECILRDLGGDKFRAHSAGTRPQSELNPFAVEVLKSKGHDVSDLRSKHVSEFWGPDAPNLDFVFTVCNQAANEECPPWDGQPVSAHWGQDDPVKATGSDAEKSLAFQQAYGILRNRISAFVNLPFDSLDRMSLQRAVDDLAQELARA